MTNPTDGAWTLDRGDELIVDLVVTGGDWPWLNADLLPHSGFEAVRPLFATDLRLLDNADGDGDGDGDAAIFAR